MKARFDRASQFITAPPGARGSLHRRLRVRAPSKQERDCPDPSRKRPARVPTWSHSSDGFHPLLRLRAATRRGTRSKTCADQTMFRVKRRVHAAVRAFEAELRRAAKTIRVGLPRVLNMYTPRRFSGLLEAVGSQIECDLDDTHEKMVERNTARSSGASRASRQAHVQPALHQHIRTQRRSTNSFRS